MCYLWLHMNVAIWILFATLLPINFPCPINVQGQRQVLYILPLQFHSAKQCTHETIFLPATLIVKVSEEVQPSSLLTVQVTVWSPTLKVPPETVTSVLPTGPLQEIIWPWMFVALTAVHVTATVVSPDAMHWPSTVGTVISGESVTKTKRQPFLIDETALHSYSFYQYRNTHTTLSISAPTFPQLHSKVTQGNGDFQSTLVWIRRP